jgi:hypothetical protein
VEHVADAMLLLAVIVPIYLGFAFLALAQQRFWRRIRAEISNATATASHPVPLLRTAGAGLLASSLPWRSVARPARRALG